MRRPRGGMEGDSAGQASGEERGWKRPRKEGDAWTIGVVSDTHGEFDPHLMELLSGVDEIWHGGDHAARNGSAASAERVLNELCKIAPVTNMVRGNVDVFAGGLRGHRGHRPAPAELQAAFPLATLRALPCGAHLRLRAVRQRRDGGCARACVDGEKEAPGGSAVMLHVCPVPRGLPTAFEASLAPPQGGCRGGQHWHPLVVKSLGELGVPLHALLHSGSMAAAADEEVHDVAEGAAPGRGGAQPGRSNSTFHAPPRLVISGHSHKASVYVHDGVLFVNPGTCGPDTVR